MVIPTTERGRRKEAPAAGRDEGTGIRPSRGCSGPREEEDRVLAIPHGEGCSSGFGEHSWESAHIPESMRSGRQLTETGEMGKGGGGRAVIIRKGFPTHWIGILPPCNSAAKRHSVRAADDFISEGIFRIAKREEREWRQQQEREIKEMLFRSPQPKIVLETIQHLQKVSDENLDELDLVDLEVATRELDSNCSMRKMDTAENPWGRWAWAAIAHDPQSYLWPLPPQAK
jgi:hypothetical protein